MNKINAWCVTVVVATMIVSMPLIAMSQEPPVWLIAPIECPNPEKFTENFMLAIGSAPTKYYTDITVIMYLMFYTGSRIDGKDPFGEDFESEIALYRTILQLYKICQKNKPFSLGTLVSIEDAIKKEHSEYYKEFKTTYEKQLRHYLNSIHGK